MLRFVLTLVLFLSLALPALGQYRRPTPIGTAGQVPIYGCLLGRNPRTGLVTCMVQVEARPGNYVWVLADPRLVSLSPKVAR